MNIEAKLEKIAERVFNASFLLTVLLIIGATIGTGIARYTLQDTKFELVPDNVFKFVEHILWIFALPISIKIIGDKLPHVVQAITAIRGNGMMGGYGYNNYNSYGNYSNPGMVNPVQGNSPTGNPGTYF